MPAGDGAPDKLPAMSTSAQLPLCVHCGTPRPADASRCPTCGRPWIDVRVIDVRLGEAAGVDPRAPIAAPSEPTSPELEAWSPRRRRREWGRWVVPGVLAGAVVAVYGLIFTGVVGAGGSSPAPTSSTGPVTSLTAAPPPSTTTTTEPPTTTTTSTEPPTTTTTVPGPEAFPPAGDPVTVDDLRLAAAGIGPLELGSPFAEVAGRLAATLGQADASGPAGADLDLCPASQGMWLRWGALTIVADGTGPAATFAAYRYDLPADGTNPDPLLRTVSGLQLGDTVADLERTYARYTISYVVVDGGSRFVLRDGEDVLLRGPVSTTDPDGAILGLWSPAPTCT